MASTIKKNIAYAFGAQGIQLIRSILVSLLIPKVMGIEEFGYWQLFIFYTQYGGFLHLGLLDGIYLHEGGKRYENLDFCSLGYQLRIFILWQILLAIPFLVGGFTCQTSQRSIILCFSCLFIIINNVLTFFLYIMQAVNLIKYSSIGKVIISLCFVFSIIILLYNNVNDYVPYIVLYIFSHIIGLGMYMVKNAPIIQSVFAASTAERKKQLTRNVEKGFILLISNLLGMLIVGFGRFMVDCIWGIKAFAFISFAFMFVNFFLMFINQASMVFFPELRRWDVTKIKHFYQKTRRILSLYSPIVFLLYTPICKLTHIWLPQYELSMKYLILLLPLCIFDTQMNLLYNTIYKVYGEVRGLFLCNMAAFFSCVFFILISIFAIKDIQFVVISMLIAITIRSVIAELYIEKNIFNEKPSKNLVYEILMIVSFIFLHSMLQYLFAWIIYSIMVLIYIYLRKNTYGRC